MVKFKEISIRGLFGETDITIPIKDNRVIIVGYNGIGKSTILNIFYYFISRQWPKLGDQEFSEISVRVSSKKQFTITKQSLAEFNARRSRWTSDRAIRVPRKILERASEILDRRGFAVSLRDRPFASWVTHAADLIGKEMRLSEASSRDIAITLLETPEFEDEHASETNEVTAADRYLRENLEGRILYLPTYRRIEKDIKTIFPQIEVEIQKKLTQIYQDSKSSNYIELVQFGMEDVKSKLSSRLESIRIFALSQVNSLTTKYLRDVIRNEANKYDISDRSVIDQISLQNVFNKVDSTLLTDKDKDKISDVVMKIRGDEELLDNEKYVAHYVMYLVEIGKNISELERPIIEFVNICNSYLYGKRFEFENVEYKVLIKHTSGRSVQMEELSSGEKQIVSLFSHLILDDVKNNYILIDEPELSLSVDWQERFLKDISNLESCKFIGAVTHSPFIFENTLDDYTVDLLMHSVPSTRT